VFNGMADVMASMDTLLFLRVAGTVAGRVPAEAWIRAAGIRCYPATAWMGGVCRARALADTSAGPARCPLVREHARATRGARQSACNSPALHAD
jgi:hypothetical protein